jgi:SAM-dependent methyltransferase
VSLGETVNEFRNEDIGRMTFHDQSLELFVSLDVMEHIPDPARAMKEIHRVLRPGGFMISTFPVRKTQVLAVEPRVEFDSNGAISKHLKPEEVHGNPINKNGSLVTYDYGYDIHLQLMDWAPFDVRVYRFADRTHGILGQYTEVVLCKRR